MYELSPQAFQLIYGMTFFVMGLAVIARVSAYPPSSFRNRLLALGASGLFHAAATWLILESVTEIGLPSYIRQISYTAGYLALFYFAFGWSERRPMMAHAIALASIGGLLTADYFIAEPASMHIVTRLGVGMPAIICAAVVFMRDSSFRFGSRPSDIARWVVATVFMFYAALNLFPAPTDFFPASVLNSDTFEAVTGMSVRAVRGGTILVITVGILSLLNCFDDVLRKQTEDALAASEKRLKKALDIGGLGSWEMIVVTGESSRSDHVYTILGISPEELKPGFAGFLEWVHPDDRADLRVAMRRALEQHTPYKIDHRIVRPDGTTRIIQANGDVEVGPDGAVHKVFGTIQDITALEEARNAVRDKEAEDRLRKSEERLREAEHIALIGNWEFDTQTGEIQRSGQDIRNFGLQPGEMRPHLEAFLERVHPDDRGWVKARVEKAKKSLQPDEYEYRTVWPNGEVRIIRAKYKFEADESGKLRKIFGVSQDITERKQAETEAASKEQQLRQAQKMEAVGQLTGGVAHDFNNLLAVINGGLELVAEEVAQGTVPKQELVESAIRAGQRGAELVRRLLAFSRQTPLKPEMTRIDKTILDTTSLLQRSLGETIDVEVRLHSEAAVTLVDRDQLGNALVNLALNARDAMVDGGKLLIETSLRPAVLAKTDNAAKWSTGMEVCIEVSDNGVGMAEDVREHAMEPFFSTKEDSNRSGLGLSMVYGFVQQSGGHITIESEIGRGTKITIGLPHILSTEFTTDVPPSEPRVIVNHEKVVLLVEDDPDVRTVTEAHLKKLGYNVRSAASGIEAIDLLVSPTAINFVLTDLVLPDGINGITVIKEGLRARPNVGLLCMSGYTPSQDNRDWLRAQNIQILDKPFSRAELADALQHLEL